MVPNPKCEEGAGCGPWSAPKVRNPEYKGKWTIPKIANPDYKGEWAPRQISNPAFFEDSSPSDFTKIAGIGIELWTMTEDILCMLPFCSMELSADIQSTTSLSDMMLLRPRSSLPKLTTSRSLLSRKPRDPPSLMMTKSLPLSSTRSVSRSTNLFVSGALCA